MFEELSTLSLPLKEKRLQTRIASKEYLSFINQKEWHKVSCDTIFPRHILKNRPPYITFIYRPAKKIVYQIFFIKSACEGNGILKKIKLTKSKVDYSGVFHGTEEFISSYLSRTADFDSIISKINISYQDTLLDKYTQGDSIIDLNFYIKRLGLDLGNESENEIVIQDASIHHRLPFLKDPPDKTNIYLRLRTKGTSIYFIIIVNSNQNSRLNLSYVRRLLDEH